MFSPSEEAADEFEKYYSQFRPRQYESYSPASTSYYSAFSSETNTNTGSRPGSDQFSFSRRHPALARDWAGPGLSRAGRPRTAEPDNISRDSGHSSGSSTSPTSPSMVRQDWTFRRTPGRHPDSFSVRSLDLGRQRPVIRPRRSLQSQSLGEERREDNPGEETANNQKAPRISLAYTVIATSLVIGSLAILVSAYTKHSCHLANSVVWDLQHLKQQLRTKVIGQTQSIGAMEDFLSRFLTSGESQLAVLMLLGSSGVGKSFISDIIQENFPLQENIHHLHTCQSMADLPTVLASSCGPSLVIVEDLEQTDILRINRLEKMLVSLRTGEMGGRRGVLVVITTRAGAELINKHALEVAAVSLANLHQIKAEQLSRLLDQSEVSLPLIKDLGEYDIPLALVPLLPLTRENVRECVYNFLIQRKVVIKQLDVSAILESLTFFSSNLPIFSRLGCKPLAAKLSSQHSQTAPTP